MVGKYKNHSFDISLKNLAYTYHRLPTRYFLLGGRENGYAPKYNKDYNYNRIVEHFGFPQKGDLTLHDESYYENLRKKLKY